MESQTGMSRLVMARTILAVIGVAIWGYGYRIDDPNVRLAGILVLAVTLVLRFVPRRWFGE
jgi:hypothetical protein